ncbi:predicted protein [Naegleria gruberi]|uniref:Predicted protein n=1 Tax=Naegleria gruberi TaxID=5762 RepID=D2W1Q4_NAEGR|nr:uncharacterized protein NAEGRDRAFT_75338 [Naegleria gruberi]EFC37005.1 predicted protein [Naegleria gruberi]|eukprot:XP_002669749.1 predicted protein [Naegleria gruberi strain NEG-M]
MKRKQTDESSQSESKKAKSTTHDHSSWFNSAVLLNVYSFLTFREVLTFRLVNQSINKELRISSESIESNDNELFFLNRLSKMNAKVKDESCDFLQGCLLKVNAEIRNCMVLDDRISYFQYLLENDTNFNVLCMNKTYSNLFKSGIVSFNSYVGGVFSQTQGGRSELKILKKSKEFMIFTQHYVYGPNTRVDNLERSYDLKVRDSNFQEKNLIWYLNYYYTWEDEPMGSGKIDIKQLTML